VVPAVESVPLLALPGVAAPVPALVPEAFAPANKEAHGLDAMLPAAAVLFAEAVFLGAHGFGIGAAVGPDDVLLVEEEDDEEVEDEEVEDGSLKELIAASSMGS